jgi:DNA-binding winged helix-turn-helix (wHTH) protein
VRRLRAKLGPEHEAMIGTVRNVGYKFVRPVTDAAGTRRLTTPSTAGAQLPSDDDADSADSSIDAAF